MRTLPSKNFARLQWKPNNSLEQTRRDRFHAHSMRGTHEHADNLFLRLFSYTPRKGRDALEDFCSEALVWCLDNSPPFRLRFFELTKLPMLKGYGQAVQIHTQQSYKQDETEDTDVSEKGLGGRFDIVIEAADASFFVAVESKVGSSFGKGQVEKYLKRLATVKRRRCFGQCELVTLTNIRDTPFDKVAHLVWGDVHDAINDAILITTASNGQTTSFETAVLKQFAAFLREKGLAHMKICKATPTLLTQFVDGMKLRESMEAILKNLKTAKHLRTLLGRKKIRYEPDTKETYLGYYASRKPFLYLGFELDQSHSAPRLLMYIEASMKGDQRKLPLPKKIKACLQQRILEKKETWFVFKQAVLGRYDGDAEAIREWFNSMSQAVLRLPK